jgi:hypothetical protein
MTDSALHNRLLKRYWFRTTERLGFGVTAFSVEDARALVEQRARELRWDYEVVTSSRRSTFVILTNVTLFRTWVRQTSGASGFLGKVFRKPRAL